jgi:hypothetical protein
MDLHTLIALAGHLATSPRLSPVVKDARAYGEGGIPSPKMFYGLLKRKELPPLDTVKKGPCAALSLVGGEVDRRKDSGFKVFHIF